MALAAPAIIIPGRSLAQDLTLGGVIARRGRGGKILGTSSLDTASPSERVFSVSQNNTGAPAPAAAVGFNTLSFSDDFTSTATIDMGNTGNPGYKWYLHHAWPNIGGGYSGPWDWVKTQEPTLPSWFSVANSIVTISQGSLATACYSPSAPGYVGSVFIAANGWYAEIRMRADPSLAALPPGWPAFWAPAVEFYVGTATRWAELDFVEYYPTVRGSASLLFGMHDWDTAAGTNNSVAPGLTPDANWHIFGTLLVTPNHAGGTAGYVKRYIDNVYRPEFTENFYTNAPASPPFGPANPVGTWSEVQNQHYWFGINTSSDVNTWPIYVDWVKVWQLTANG